MTAGQETRPGIGVDAGGGSVIDPTANAIALNEAGNRRQDDLRAASDKFNEAQTAHVKEISDLRAQHAKELSDKESDRIDAIRNVDVTNAAVANQRAADQASVLAAQVATSAEVLRNLVQTTATAAAETLQQLIGPLVTRITTLEQALYKGEGKQGFTDPMLASLVEEVRALRNSQSTSTGKSQGISASWAVLIAVILGTAALVTMFFRLSGAP